MWGIGCIKNVLGIAGNMKGYHEGGRTIMNNEEIYETTGFDAISERLALLYPNQKERHYGTVIKYALGGKDPLDGISVYKSEKGMPHWHYISYGFTELYEKESEDKLSRIIKLF